MPETQIQFITKDTIIGDIMAKYPYLADTLLSYGIHCVGCHVNTMDTLAQGAAEFGMPAEQMDSMIEELNELVSKRGEEPAQPADEPAEFTLSFTEKAAEKLKTIMKEQNKAGWGIRIGVVPGGCSGFSYMMDFDNTAGPDDIVLNHGVKVFVDKRSTRHLQGVQVDFIESLQGSGFKFNNPNAAGSCGCGKSFS